MRARAGRLAELQAQLAKSQAETEIYRRLYLNAGGTLDSLIASSQLYGDGHDKGRAYLLADREIRRDLYALDNKEIRK